MNNFIDVVDWLHNVNAKFGVDHVVVQGEIYYLDSDCGRTKLLNLYILPR